MSKTVHWLGLGAAFVSAVALIVYGWYSNISMLLVFGGLLAIFASGLL